MTIIESINLRNYVQILKYNNKTPEQIEILKKEYINYVDNNGPIISNELEEYLNYLNKQSNSKKI